MAQGHKMWLIPTQGSEMFIIFSFLRSDVEAKHGVEFRHSTHNASRTEESGERSVLTLGSHCLPCYIRNTAWDYKILFSKFHFQHLLPWTFQSKHFLKIKSNARPLTQHPLQKASFNLTITENSKPNNINSTLKTCN